MENFCLIDPNKKEFSLYSDISLLDMGFSDFSRNIKIHSSIVVNYVLILEWWESDLSFVVDKNSILNLSVMVVWSTSQVSTKIQVHLSWDKAQTKFYCVSFLEDGSDVRLDAGIVIEKNCVAVEWDLLEENILLGVPSRFRTTPLLDIYSDDVRASHAAKTHRLDFENLFYLQSKWISQPDAKKIFISSYINKVFSIFPDQDSSIIVEEKNRLLELFVL